jgi:Cdc6-like AAA superfamily ATPase
VTNRPDEEPSWKAAIIEHQIAIMGWEEHTKFGRMFIEEIQQGDIVLVAQGANRQKRLFLAGRVASEAFQRHLPNTSRSALQRQLVSCIGKEELYAMALDFNGSAYGDTNQIPALYRLKPSENEKDKAIAEQLELGINGKREVEPKENVERMKNITDLLKYKKQIILQGPPGTGKTKLAKEIANELIGIEQQTNRSHSTIDKAAIQHLLKAVSSIKTKSGKKLIIVDVKDAVVDVKTDDSQVWSPSYNKIIGSYNGKLFNDPSRTGGFTPYEDAIAKHLFENHGTMKMKAAGGQLKLIQFHPSYSYEDFVRGIVAKPNDEGDGILYEAENKLLARFAEEAVDNNKSSQISSEEASKVIQTKSKFESFIQYVQDFIAESPDQKFPLTNDVYLFSSDTTRFKYKGDNWIAHSKGLNMKYSELQKIIDAGVTERSQIKSLIGLEELTKQHATYFFNTVKKFSDFLQANPITTGAITTKEMTSLKNYVLIIDEINRANLSSVLGELIYALEYRGENVESMYEVDGSNALLLPPNLYIIGTMNTADRSVGHIDYAIRRRFAFVDVLPENLTTNDEIVFHQQLFRAVSELFVANLHDYLTDSTTLLKHSKYLSQEFLPKDVWLGHSYFLQKKVRDSADNVTLVPTSMAIRVRYEIIPLLEEYIKDGVLIDSEDLRGIIKDLETAIG